MDTIIVGRFLSVSALAAVGSTGSICFLIIGLLSGCIHKYNIVVKDGNVIITGGSISGWTPGNEEEDIVIKIIRIIKKCLIVIKISCKVQRKYVNMAKIIHINNIKY